MRSQEVLEQTLWTHVGIIVNRIQSSYTCVELEEIQSYVSRIFLEEQQEGYYLIKNV